MNDNLQTSHFNPASFGILFSFTSGVYPEVSKMLENTLSSLENVFLRNQEIKTKFNR